MERKLRMINLPPIIPYNRFQSDEEFINYAYSVFLQDFIEYPPKLYNAIVKTLPQKMRNGYNKTFWHLITEGDHLENSAIIPDRIERLPWINPIIEGQPDSNWLMWEKPAKRENTRVLIYNTYYRYLVVIEKRPATKVVFWTAYPIGINNRHQERKLLKEYSQYGPYKA